MKEDSLFVVNSVDIQNVPDLVKLLPLGDVRSQKGDFIVDRASFDSMNRQFHNHNVDVVIDYEHQTLNDVQAPAGGWIKSLILKNDGIYARVEWTKKARDFIKNKEYRYLSPVVLIDRESGRAVSLHSVALTNVPAIDGMKAIINSMDKGDKVMDNQKNTGDLQQTAYLDPAKSGNSDDLIKDIIQALGLEESATPDEIIQAIRDLSSGKGKGELETVSNKLEVDKVKAESANLVQMALSLGQIDQSQTEWAYNRCREDMDGFRYFVQGAYRKECEKTVELALKTGKIAPYQRAWAEQLAMKDLDSLKTFVSQAQAVVPMGELNYFKDDYSDTGRTTGAGNKVNDLLGLTDEEVRKYNR